MSGDFEMNGECPAGINPSVKETEEEDMPKNKKVEERGAWGGMYDCLSFFSSVATLG